VLAKLDLLYDRDGKPEQIRCEGECLVEGNPEEIKPVDVAADGYDFVPEQNQLESGIILVSRKEPLEFRAAIQPQPPGDDDRIRKPSRSEYQAAVRHDHALDGGKFVCDNQTPYLLDVLVFPWKPTDTPPRKHFRYMSVPPCPSREIKSYQIIEDDPSVYYFIYGSILGQTAQYLTQGSLHDPAILTLKVRMATGSTGALEATVRREEPTELAKGDSP